MNEINGWDEFFNKKLNEEAEQEEEYGERQEIKININDMKIVNWGNGTYILAIDTPQGYFTTKLHSDTEWEDDGPEA